MTESANEPGASPLALLSLVVTVALGFLTIPIPWLPRIALAAFVGSATGWILVRYPGLPRSFQSFLKSVTPFQGFLTVAVFALIALSPTIAALLLRPSAGTLLLAGTASLVAALAPAIELLQRSRRGVPRWPVTWLLAVSPDVLPAGAAMIALRGLWTNGFTQSFYGAICVGLAWNLLSRVSVLSASGKGAGPATVRSRLGSIADSWLAYEQQERAAKLLTTLAPTFASVPLDKLAREVLIVAGDRLGKTARIRRVRTELVMSIPDRSSEPEAERRADLLGFLVLVRGAESLNTLAERNRPTGPDELPMALD
jgi:hypothetical protein